MKKSGLFILVTLLLSNLLDAQIKLEIEIENLKNDAGDLLLGLVYAEKIKLTVKWGKF